MGAGGQFNFDKHFHETEDTRSATRDNVFDSIIGRIEKAGGKVTQDEELPYYKNEIEVGTERVVEFDLREDEYRISRVTETMRVNGHSVEERESPFVSITLKKRSAGSPNWEGIDLSNFA